MELLKVDRLARSFGDRKAVRGVSFSVARGEVVAVLGPNGAGKSTTMRMIAGYLRPDAGDAVIAGASITHNRLTAQSRLGYLPEGAPLYTDLTPAVFLRFLARARGMSAPRTHWALEHMAADCGIDSVLNRPIDTLSKGYRRRVALAGALLHDPPVLLLDEPTDGLDPNQKAAVRDLVSRLARTKAILISTHQLDEVESMCSRAVVISQGRKEADDTPAELAARAPGGRLADAFRLMTRRGEPA